MSHKLILSRNAKKGLKSLPLKKQKLFEEVFKNLKIDPLSVSSKKMKGKRGKVAFKVNIEDDHRLIYLILSNSTIKIIHANTREKTDYRKILHSF